MEPVVIGQILCCDKCGVELKVIKDCDSTCVCNIICCEEPMRAKENPQEEDACQSCVGNPVDISGAKRFFCKSGLDIGR